MVALMDQFRNCPLPSSTFGSKYMYKINPTLQKIQKINIELCNICKKQINIVGWQNYREKTMKSGGFFSNFCKTNFNIGLEYFGCF